MANPLNQYLEQAKLEELSQLLQQQGFIVKREVPLGNLRLDLTAERGTEKVAYEVVASDSLGVDSERIASLRNLALKAGYRELRLSVVSPPRTIEVDIDGFEETLSEYMQNPLPTDLDVLSTHTEFRGVDELELDSIDINRTRIRVVGSGVADIVLNFGNAMDEEDSAGIHESVTFDFDISLNHELRIADVHFVEFDTSSIHEPDIGDFDYGEGNE
jgi:hypothetical protein